MLGKIHSTSGKSFRGLAEYLLDELKEESESRVAWVETRNLGTTDGMTASRVMSANAYHHEQLKADAGVAKQGQKMKGPVMHVSISWKEDEVKDLTREKMLAVADLAIAKFGKDNTRGKNVPKHGGRRQFGDQHQAMIVCHDDKEHPHVHIVINRVHPEHGVMLPTSYDRLKLSKVGLKFEKENEKIVCQERVTNWQARDNGQFVRAEKELPRKTWEKVNNLKPEMEKKARMLMEAERKKAAQIAQDARDQKARHKQEWNQLEQQTKERATKLVHAREKAFKAERHRITQINLQKRREQLNERQAAIALYDQREKTRIGKIQNRLRGIDLKSLVGIDKTKDPDGRAKTWGEAFNVIGSAGAAKQALKTKHELIAKRTNRQEKRELGQAQTATREEFKANLSEHRDQLQQERQEVIFKQRLETAKVRAEWKTFESVRSTNWQPLQRPPSRKELLEKGFKNKPEQSKGEKNPRQIEYQPSVKVDDIVPRSKRVALLIDDYLDKNYKESKQQDAEPQQDTDKGKDDGRGI